MRGQHRIRRQHDVLAEEAPHADKPLYVLHGEFKTPPMSALARVTVAFLLRRVQQGEHLTMPDSRPMPELGASCHELRIEDDEMNASWRVIYVIDDVAIFVLDVFKKESRATSESVKKACRDRLSRYLAAKKGTKR